MFLSSCLGIILFLVNMWNFVKYSCYGPKFLHILFLIFWGAILLGVIDFSFSAFVKSILPTIFSKYWFFTAYIVFLLLSPYINKMLKSLTRKEYELLLIIMLIIWCIIPTIFSRVPSGDAFAIFLLLYALGAYFKLFPENKWNKKKLVSA